MPVGDSHDERPIFRHQREASAIELFYDLFFVANLATVTINNEIADGISKI
jgi:low temperature requirement protein LtrA